MLDVIRRCFAAPALGVAVVLLAGCDHAVVDPPGLGGDERRRAPRVENPPTAPVPTTSCPEPPQAAVPDDPDARRITVGAESRQAITGWGASVVSDTYVDPLVNPTRLPARQLRELDERVFGEAGINLVRVFGPGFGRAPVVAPPQVRERDRVFAFMRRVARYGVKFMFTGADAPPALKQGRRLRAGAEADYAAYVADYLETARRMGTPFSYAAIANEPENRASRLQIPPAQAALVYTALAGEIERRKLGVRLILGDTTGWGSACPYALQLTALPELRAAAEAFATHPYFGTIAQARALALQVRSAGLDVWQTEFGTGCADCPDDGGIHEAVLWARAIAEALEAGRVSAWFTFRAVADARHGPGDGLLVRRRDSRKVPFYPTKRFEVFRQFSAYARPGSRVLPVTERVPGVIAVAFEGPGGRSIVLTNIDRRIARRVDVDLGPAAGALAGRRTSGPEDFRALPAVRYTGRPAPVELPPDSVTTLTLRPRG